MLFWAQFFWMSIGSPIIIQLRNTLLWTFRKSRIESVSCGIELPQVSENRGIRSALDGTWLAVTYLFRILKVVCNIRFCSGRVVRKTVIKRPLDANKSNCIHESGAIGSKWNKFFEFRVFTVSVGTYTTTTSSGHYGEFYVWANTLNLLDRNKFVKAKKSFLSR